MGRRFAVHWRGGGYFTHLHDFYLPSRHLEEGEGESAPCGYFTLLNFFILLDGLLLPGTGIYEKNNLL
jgi:hypothetical protein